MKKLSVIMCLTALTLSIATCGSKPVETSVTEPAQTETAQSESVEMITEEVSETVVCESEIATEEVITETVESSEEQVETEASGDVIKETIAEETVTQTVEAVAEEPIVQTVESAASETASNVTVYTISNTDSVGSATVTVNVYDRPSSDGIVIGTIEANEPIYCLCKVFDNGWHTIDTEWYDIPYTYGFVDPSVVSNPKADAMTTHFPESSFWELSVTVNPDGTATVTEVW